MIYFVSGHRDLSYEDFEKYYIPVLRYIIDNEMYSIFVVGDCDGVDKYAMDYLYYNLRYKGELHIYHMLDSSRNVPEGYKGHEFIDDGMCEVIFHGQFKSDEERDSAMTQASDCDIAFIKDDRWDSGTAQNIKRRHEISNNLFNNSDYISDSTND